jgi:hypothetical protein
VRTRPLVSPSPCTIGSSLTRHLSTRPGARWDARKKWSNYGTEVATRKRWNEVLSEQRKQKAEEDARAAEVAVRQAEEKAEERTKFFAGDGNVQPTPVSSWADRELKVIIKVCVLDWMSRAWFDCRHRLRTTYSSPGRTTPDRGISRAWCVLTLA